MRKSKVLALLVGSIALMAIALYWPTAEGLVMATEPPLQCDSDGYWLDSKDHPMEWSGRLIGTMVSGAEIGLEAVSGTAYPAFDVYLGDELNIETNYPEADWNSIIHVKGYWQGIDCELYRSIYGDACVPLIEAAEIYIEK